MILISQTHPVIWKKKQIKNVEISKEIAMNNQRNQNLNRKYIMNAWTVNVRCRLCDPNSVILFHFHQKKWPDERHTIKGRRIKIYVVHVRVFLCKWKWFLYSQTHKKSFHFIHNISHRILRHTTQIATILSPCWDRFIDFRNRKCQNQHQPVNF